VGVLKFQDYEVENAEPLAPRASAAGSRGAWRPAAKADHSDAEMDR